MNFLKKIINWIKANSDRLLLNKKSPIGLKNWQVIAFPAVIWLISFISQSVSYFIQISSYVAMAVLPANLFDIYLKGLALAKVFDFVLLAVAFGLFIIVFFKIINSIKSWKIL